MHLCGIGLSSHPSPPPGSVATTDTPLPHIPNSIPLNTRQSPPLPIQPLPLPLPLLLPPSQPPSLLPPSLPPSLPQQHTRSPPDLIHSYCHFAPQRKIVTSSISSLSRHSGCSSHIGQSPPPNLRQNHCIRGLLWSLSGAAIGCCRAALAVRTYELFLAFRFETSCEQPHVLRSRSVCCLQRYTALINCEVVACRPSKGSLWQSTFSICPPVVNPLPFPSLLPSSVLLLPVLSCPVLSCLVLSCPVLCRLSVSLSYYLPGRLTFLNLLDCLLCCLPVAATKLFLLLFLHLHTSSYPQSTPLSRPSSLPSLSTFRCPTELFATPKSVHGFLSPFPGYPFVAPSFSLLCCLLTIVRPNQT
ncbi:hypothetical protein BZA77DRAFT_71020 [Pyronema omphalodes]|nr:hypothetical protein BZA77DRAFT_71020 [Pyronema omphalodes]